MVVLTWEMGVGRGMGIWGGGEGGLGCGGEGDLGGRWGFGWWRL